MTSTITHHAAGRVLREIDLGHHHLLLMSDQSIELMRDEAVPDGAEKVLSLDGCETYHLLLSLQEMFQAGPE